MSTTGLNFDLLSSITRLLNRMSYKDLKLDKNFGLVKFYAGTPLDNGGGDTDVEECDDILRHNLYHLAKLVANVKQCVIFLTQHALISLDTKDEIFELKQELLMSVGMWCEIVKLDKSAFPTVMEIFVNFGNDKICTLLAVHCNIKIQPRLEPKVDRQLNITNNFSVTPQPTAVPADVRPAPASAPLAPVRVNGLRPTKVVKSALTVCELTVTVVLHSRSGLEKPYTPIPLISKRLREIYSVKADPSRGQVLYFYIKIYTTGKLTPMINSINLDVPNEIMVGDLTGSFDPEFLINTDRLILLAGGTGITPFISLIQFLMEKRNTYTVQQVVLVHSVASAEQLLWPQALEAISKEGNWFYYYKYKHATKAKNSPAQQNHHLDLPTIEGLLRKIPKFKGLFIDEPLYAVRAMACGPKGFLATSKSIFEFLGISQRNILILS